jgi:signal transduction histidine kinase
VHTGAALLLAAAAGFTARPDDRMPATAPGAAGVEPSPAILMISTDDPGRPHVQELVQGFLAAVSEAAVPPTVYVEYFDQVRFGDRPAYGTEFLEWLGRKYRDRSIGVIVATGDLMLELLAERGGGPWPGVPLVFGTLGKPGVDARGASSVVMENPLPLAFQTIRALLPGTRRIAFISGSSAAEMKRDTAAVALVREAGVDVLHVSGLSIDEVLVRVGALPEGTIPYLITFQVDAARRTFTGHQACERIAAAANRPMFSMGRDDVGRGMVGGPVMTLVPLGRALAGEARRRLAGEPVRTVTVTVAEHSPLTFDARQLERWGIPESRLPAASTVLFRSPSLWRDNRGAVLAALAIGAAQTLLIALILLERQRRARTQAALATSYRQLQDLAGRLVTAEEAERTRIARDLHDDIGQRVASLSIALSGLRRTLPDPEGSVCEEVASLQRQASAVSADLRQLSHDLHPGALEHLGLLEALRGRCDDVRAQTGIEARLEVAEGWSDVPDAAGLCLYRVAQEALRNVAQHAQARSACISLERRDGSVWMRVSDDGRGFERAARSPGLGLVSLGERVRLLGGTLDLRTAEAAGTTLVVTLPAGGRHGT